MFLGGVFFFLLEARTASVLDIHVCLYLFFHKIQISSKGQNKSYILIRFCLCSQVPPYLDKIPSIMSLSSSLNSFVIHSIFAIAAAKSLY